MSKTSIEWTRGDDGTAGYTWNPVTGCTEISPGCDHCYARTFAERFRGVQGHPYEQGFDLKLWPERLTLPLRWKKPRKIFVNSMSDLFHKDVPYDFIARVFAVMAMTPQHVYQVLTKRPKRMARIVNQLYDKGALDIIASIVGNWWDGVPSKRITANHVRVSLPNVWLGTSIESDEYTWRADYLRKVPAAVRFISAEPLLSGLPSLNLDGISWLIVGGESGHGARPMHPDWARSLRDQCQAAGVAYFFKQWGEWLPMVCERDSDGVGHLIGADGRRLYIPDLLAHAHEIANDRGIIRLGKKAAGRLLDGRTWDEYPQRIADINDEALLAEVERLRALLPPQEHANA